MSGKSLAICRAVLRPFARKLLAMPFRSRLLLAAVGPLVPALVGGIIGLSALFGTVRTYSDSLAASRQLDQVRAIATLVLDAESYARGFFNTGTANHLQAYELAAVQVPVLLEELELRLGGDPKQAARIASMRSSFEHWRVEIAEPMISGQREALYAGEPPMPLAAGPDPQANLTVREDSRRLIQEIRALLGDFEQAEHDRLRDGIGRSERVRSIALAAAAVGLALAVVVGVWMAWVISRRTARELQDLATVAGAIAKGDLKLRAREKGSAEVVAVSQSFNRMADRIAERRDQQATLQELSPLLQASQTPDEAGQVAARYAPLLVPHGGGALYLLDESRTTARKVFQFGSTGSEFDFAPTDCWAIRRAQRHLVRHGHEPLCAHVPGGAALALCLPLATQGETFGIFHFRVNEPTPDGVDAEELVAAATTFGAELSLAFATLRLVDRLRQQSIRDPLTGLYNRRYFDETLERELARARRAGKPLSLAMIDLDHFKRFNDTFGHEAGDMVLKETGSLLRQLFRSVDVPCRLGGEELAVILPDAGPDQVRSRLDEFAMRLRNRDLKLRQQPLGRVTASVGVAGFPEHGGSAADLVRAADDALYGAKRAGRDRLAIAS